MKIHSLSDADFEMNTSRTPTRPMKPTTLPRKPPTAGVTPKPRLSLKLRPKPSAGDETELRDAMECIQSYRRITPTGPPGVPFPVSPLPPTPVKKPAMDEGKKPVTPSSFKKSPSVKRLFSQKPRNWRYKPSQTRPIDLTGLYSQERPEVVKVSTLALNVQEFADEHLTPVGFTLSKIVHPQTLAQNVQELADDRLTPASCTPSKDDQPEPAENLSDSDRCVPLKKKKCRVRWANILPTKCPRLRWRTLTKEQVLSRSTRIWRLPPGEKHRVLHHDAKLSRVLLQVRGEKVWVKLPTSMSTPVPSPPIFLVRVGVTGNNKGGTAVWKSGSA